MVLIDKCSAPVPKTSGLREIVKIPVKRSFRIGIEHLKLNVRICRKKEVKIKKGLHHSFIDSLSQLIKYGYYRNIFASPQCTTTCTSSWNCKQF